MGVGEPRHRRDQPILVGVVHGRRRDLRHRRRHLLVRGRGRLAARAAAQRAHERIHELHVDVEGRKQQEERPLRVPAHQAVGQGEAEEEEVDDHGPERHHDRPVLEALQEHRGDDDGDADVGGVGADVDRHQQAGWVLQVPVHQLRARVVDREVRKAPPLHEVEGGLHRRQRDGDGHEQDRGQDEHDGGDHEGRSRAERAPVPMSLFRNRDSRRSIVPSSVSWS